MSWIACTGLTIFVAIFPTASGGLLTLLLATIGIGHGAVDHLIVARCRAARGVSQATIIAVYVAVAVVGFVIFLALPWAGLLGFFLLSIWHFGSADYYMTKNHDQSLRAKAEIMLRGSVPLFFGTILHPAPIMTPALALFSVTVIVMWIAKQRPPEDCIDLLLPAIVVGVLPFGIGFVVYFVAWHALRHGFFIRDFTGSMRTAHGDTKLSIRAFVPFTLVGILYLVVGIVVAARFHIAPLLFVISSLFAITIPHEIVVAIMRQNKRRYA